MQKKWLLLIILTGFLALPLFFSREITLSFFQYYSGDSIQGNWRMDENGIIHIDSFSMKGEGMELVADVVAIDYELSWLSLKTKVSLHKPLLTLTTQDAGDFQLKSILEIDQGVIRTEGLEFAVEGTLDPDDIFKSTLSLENDTSKLLYANEKLDLLFRETEITPLFNLISPFVPELQGFKVNRGILQGEIHLSKVRGHLHEVIGSLGIKNLEFENKFVQASIPILAFEADFQKKMPKIVIGKARFLEESEFTITPHGKDPYLFVVKEGIFSLETIKTINYQLVGKSLHNGRMLPFEGQGSINLFHPGKEAFSLNLGFVYHKSGQSKAEIMARELGSGWRGLSLLIANITEREYAFFRDFSAFFPENLPEIDFHEGTVDGMIKGHIYGNRVKDITIDHVHFKDSHLDLKDRNLTIKAKDVSVKGSLNLLAKANAEVSLKGAHIEGKAPFPYIVDHCDAELSLENGVAKSLKAAGFFQEIACKIDYEELLGAKVSFNCPSSCLGKFLPEKFHKVLDDDLISVESHINEREAEFDIEGKAAFKDTHGTFRLNTKDFSTVDGLFTVENLDLNCLVAPIIFGDDIPLNLWGTASGTGTFSQNQLSLSYDAKDAKLESGAFLIELDKTHQKAAHTFNFKEGTHFGTIPLLHGIYKDKYSGNEFQEILGTVFLDNHGVKVQNVECLSSGMHFKANIAVDCTIQEKDAYDVHIVTDEISGRASSLKDFVSHLNSASYISYIPLDGEIRSGKEDCSFTFKIRDKTEVLTRIKGSLFEGSIPIPLSNTDFRELGFDIAYESGGKLAITGIQGTLITNHFKKPKEYFLNSDGIIFDKGKSQFNVWLEGGGHELFRLVGASSESEILPDLSKSHFFGIHPEEFRIAMNGLGAIRGFAFAINIDLGDLSQSVQESISKLSALWIDEQEKNSLSGLVKLTIDFDESKEAWGCQTIFENLKIGSRAFKQSEIQGSYRNKTFSIDNFQFDDLSLAATITKCPESWIINFLGGSLKDKLTFGCEGIFDPKTSEISGKIRRLIADPSIIDLFYKDEKLDLNRFQGTLTGTGDFTLKSGELALDMLLNGKLRIDNTNGVEIKPFILTYSKPSGITLKDFEADLSFLDQKAVLATVKLGKEATLQGKEWRLNNVTFSLTEKSIKPIFNMLSPWFSLSKLENVFQGSDYEGILSVVDGTCFISLKEGKLRLFEGPRTFRNFSMEMARSSLKVLADLAFGSRWIRARGFSSDSLREQGEIELTDPLEENSGKISVTWKREDEAFEIVNAKGALAGLTVDLVAGEAHALKGTVGIDTAKVAPYMSPMPFSGNFKIAGNFAFPNISGRLIGQNITVKNLLLAHLDADILVDREMVTLKKAEIKDPAGSIKIREATVSFDKGTVRIPHLFAESIRPANIRLNDGFDFLKNKALKINDVKIENITFPIDNPVECKAIGSLKFSNPSKSLLQNPLFQIPMEIVTRLGLNPSVLTPVRGEIFFECAHEKIYITKLKDVFSESRGSKFYLASKANPSYVDFDGNMFLQIRMKQYNILFKLAELFTVTVKGHYQKPLYFLQKQE